MFEFTWDFLEKYIFLKIQRIYFLEHEIEDKKSFLVEDQIWFILYPNQST